MSAPISITPCTKYLEDPNICDDVGEPKGQCLNCGAKWFEHDVQVLPDDDKDSAMEMQERLGVVPTFDILLKLTNEAGRNAFYHIYPRYSSGSPAMIPMGQVIKAAVEEYHSWQRCLTGIFGDELKAKAETEKLGNIAYARWQKGAKTWRLDLLTREKYIEPERLSWADREKLKNLRWSKANFSANQWSLIRDGQRELDELERRAWIHHSTT